MNEEDLITNATYGVSNSESVDIDIKGAYAEAIKSMSLPYENARFINHKTPIKLSETFEKITEGCSFEALE